MTYRVNGKLVSREEFLANAKGIDFSAPPASVLRDYESYNCPITGKLIEGRKAHRENLEKHGCRIFEPGEHTDFVKNRERSIRENAERTADFLMERIAEKF